MTQPSVALAFCWSRPGTSSLQLTRVAASMCCPSTPPPRGHTLLDSLPPKGAIGVARKRGMAGRKDALIDMSLLCQLCRNRICISSNMHPDMQKSQSKQAPPPCNDMPPGRDLVQPPPCGSPCCDQAKAWLCLRGRSGPKHPDCHPDRHQPTEPLHWTTRMDELEEPLSRGCARISFNTVVGIVLSRCCPCLLTVWHKCRCSRVKEGLPAQCSRQHQALSTLDLGNTAAREDVARNGTSRHSSLTHTTLYIL